MPSKKPGPGGKVSVLLTPHQLLDRLSALIPPPRRHRHRYYGVLAPNSPWHSAVTALAAAESARDEGKAKAEAETKINNSAPSLARKGRILRACLCRVQSSSSIKIGVKSAGLTVTVALALLWPTVLVPVTV